MNIATLDDQLREEVSLSLHRDIPTGLTHRSTGRITLDDKKKEEKLVLARLQRVQISITCQLEKVLRTHSTASCDSGLVFQGSS